MNFLFGLVHLLFAQCLPEAPTVESAACVFLHVIASMFTVLSTAASALIPCDVCSQMFRVAPHEYAGSGYDRGHLAAGELI